MLCRIVLLRFRSVQELVHPSNLLQHGQNALQIPQPQLSITPVSPNFPVTQPLNISQEVLATWAQTASMIMSNPSTPESSQALTALGDQLAAHHWTEAAHAWYMLSSCCDRSRNSHSFQLPSLSPDVA